MTHADLVAPPSAEGVGAEVWRLVEVDGVAEYVWREGEVAYGVQERGMGEEGADGEDGREVTLAFIAPRTS